MLVRRRKVKRRYSLREFTVGRVELCLLLNGLPFPLIRMHGAARWLPWVRRKAVLEAAKAVSDLMGASASKGSSGGDLYSYQDDYYALLTSILQLSHAKGWTPSQVREIRYKEFNYLVYVLNCENRIKAGKKDTMMSFKAWQDSTTLNEDTPGLTDI